MCIHTHNGLLARKTIPGHEDWTVHGTEGAAYTVYVRLLLLYPVQNLEVLSLPVQEEKVDLDSGKGGRLEPEIVSPPPTL